MTVTMTTLQAVPVDEVITIAELTTNPYPIYAKCRNISPVLKVSAVGRTMLTKAVDTRYVKQWSALLYGNTFVTTYVG